MVRAAGLAPASSCFRGGWPRANARLLLTLHPEIGCQGWTRTNTVRFNKPSCYFDTTWELGIGAAGRICTRMGSFRRRMPRRFRPRQHLEMVSAAGIAPAIPRSQAECVGCSATRCWPRSVHNAGDRRMQDTNPDNGPAASSMKNLALTVGLAPTLVPQTTGCFSVQLRELKW